MVDIFTYLLAIGVGIFIGIRIDERRWCKFHADIKNTED